MYTPTEVFGIDCPVPSSSRRPEVRVLDAPFVTPPAALPLETDAARPLRNWCPVAHRLGPVLDRLVRALRRLERSIVEGDLHVGAGRRREAQHRPCRRRLRERQLLPVRLDEMYPER